MFERFTESSIKVIMLAQLEAQRLGYAWVGSAQLLMGLAEEPNGNGGQCLKARGFDLQKARVAIEELIGRRHPSASPQPIPFDDHAKQLLEGSWEVAKSAGCRFIGTEHILLSLLRLGECRGLEVLQKLSLDIQRLTWDLESQIQIQGSYPSSAKQLGLALDFTYIEDWSYKFEFDETKWIAYLEQDGFLGGQIFTVGELNFSGDYPLLAFARWLNAIAHNLKEAGRGGFYQDPECQKGCYTEFALDTDYVLIKEMNTSTKESLFTARVPLNEFVNKSGAYRDRLWKHCCQLFPPLGENEDVKAWWNDLPVPPLPFANKEST